jgi:mannose-6-phosphate isomerase-like protein (cupin superfamily)
VKLAGSTVDDPMPLHKNLLNEGHPVSEVEKHFHDHDETWLVRNGRGTSFSIDHEGAREEFELEAGDVWLIPAGFEHGLVPSTGIDLELAVFIGTRPEGSHEYGHYYVEEQRYIPSLRLVKTPTDRYEAGLLTQ